MAGGDFARALPLGERVVHEAQHGTQHVWAPWKDIHPHRSMKVLCDYRG